MSKFCEVCNKGVMSGNRVSHSNRKTPHAWAPNIQRVSVVVGWYRHQDERLHSLPSFRQSSAQRLIFSQCKYNRPILVGLFFILYIFIRIRL